MLLLEFNDLALTLRSPQRTLYQQAGVALARGDALCFGAEAFAESRLHPLECNTSYLEKLSAEPLPRPLGPARTYADLIYRQLLEVAQVAEGEPVTVSVCASTSPEQLAVLLGIAAEAKLSVRQFVNHAVLLASAVSATGPLTVVELHRHRLVLTRVEVGDQTRYLEHEEFTGTGLQGFLDSWTHQIADQFISASRFDPLHSAATEQQLLNRLEAWRLNWNPESRELTVDIEQQGEARRAQLPVSALLEKSSQRLSAVEAQLPATASVLLTPSARQIPGVAAYFENRQAATLTTDDGTLAHALLAQQPSFDGDQVQLITTLPRIPPSGARKADQIHVPTPRPEPTTEHSIGLSTGIAVTHLLNDGRAQRIGEALLAHGLPLARHSQAQLRVMPSADADTDALSGPGGAPLAEGASLGAGSEFFWRGERYQLIHVDSG